MKIVFFTFYYPPDLCAGSFRAVALAKALSDKLNSNDELHVITTHPNRYASYKVKAQDIEKNSTVTVHRIAVPEHNNSMLTQVRTFSVFAFSSYKLCKLINPNFIIGTTSRLMTGVLAGVSSHKLKCGYFIDLRDIFSETISEIFSYKSKIFGSVSRAIFSCVEIRLFNNASGVNVVSEGFPEYFQKKGIDVSNWSFFPNGIDNEFQKTHAFKKNNTSIKTILYAGNIGAGQGLETILPKVAKKLGNDYCFLVIGDGGARHVLEKSIMDNNVENIKIIPPVKREDLIDLYRDADILFLHLNDLRAFRRVLPSKIFEYAAFRKPIVAGLSGYSHNFVIDNIPYAKLFSPGNVEECIKSIKCAEHVILDKMQIKDFINNYSREQIMNNMSNHIISIFNNPS